MGTLFRGGGPGGAARVLVTTPNYFIRAILVMVV